jgi:hypothetical protein
MTATEMHQSFKFGMDKMDALDYPNFLPEEIDLLLTQGQERYTKQRYGITNPKRTSFEETQKRTDDLKELIRSVTITNYNTTGVSTNISSKAKFFPLPADYWFAIQERIEQTCDKCNDRTIYIVTFPGDEGTPIEVKYAEVRPIQHNEFDKTIKDAFKKPDYDKVLRLMYESNSEIITSANCNAIHYKLRYIKKPQAISKINNTNCELSEHTHQEIVDEAIKIALEGIEAKRNSSFTPIIDNQKE